MVRDRCPRGYRRLWRVALLLDATMIAFAVAVAIVVALGRRAAVGTRTPDPG